MKTKSKRQEVRERHRKHRFVSQLIWGGIGVAVLAVIGFIVGQAIRPAPGESIPIMATSHIPTDSNPGQYNSDPPTSGLHYSAEARAGFYDANNYKYPAGYLVHNLEHGYVIFWYNCNKLSETACRDLKAQIKSMMDGLGGTKLIAYPWPSFDVPLVMTSWGRLEKFEIFNAHKTNAFYRANLNRAPEPNAP